MYALRGIADKSNDDYIPSLYLKSTYKFKKAPNHIEKAMVSFKEGILQQQMLLNQRFKKKPKRNLTPLQVKLLRQL